MTCRQFVSRLVQGLLSKDTSVAAGIVLALLVWTLTRIVDEVTNSPTVEYAVTYAPTVLADRTHGAVVHVVLSNLSNDTSIQDLSATISDPTGHTRFILDKHPCSYPPPISVDNTTVCDVIPEGLIFRAPWLIPNTRLLFSVRYIGSLEPDKRPVVRIQPGGTNSKGRLVEAGYETWLVRNQFCLLWLLLGVTTVLYVITVAAGVVEKSNSTPGGTP